MRGRKPDGSLQTFAEAYQVAQNLLQEWITPNPASIAAAVHLIQDSYSPAHAPYKIWDGGYRIPFTNVDLPGPRHAWLDEFSRHQQPDVLVATQQFLRDLNSNQMAYPSSYLNQVLSCCKP